MSSPGNSAILALIKINKNSNDAVYLQIANELINAILNKKIRIGTQLPSSRMISENLKIHRKTVVAAMDELKNQGWIETIPGKGTFVDNPEQAQQNKYLSLSEIEETENFLHQNFILDSLDENKLSANAFTDGTTDLRLISNIELSRFYASALRRKTSLQTNAKRSGNLFFKQQLSAYINAKLGIHLSEKNLLSVQNKEIALYILALVAIKKGDLVLVSEYSNPVASMIFQQAGAIINTLPADDEGICVSFIKENYHLNAIKFIYLQPEHQYPTTATLSEQRRNQLMMMATELNFLIIEDGSETEISFARTNVSTLLLKSKGRNVIYLGTFGQYLPREFQCSYLICNEIFLNEAIKYVHLFGQTDFLKEQILAEIISAGAIQRFHRKAVKIFKERRKLFGDLLLKYFGSSLQFELPEGGMAFWITTSESGSLLELKRNALKIGLTVPFNCLYQNRTITALRLGFADLNPIEMEQNVSLLKLAFDATFIENSSE